MHAQSLLQVNINNGRGEYVRFAEDVTRIITIQVVLQILMSLQGIGSMNLDFVVYLLQVMAGIAVYWLVVRRAVKIGKDDAEL